MDRLYGVRDPGGSWPAALMRWLLLLGCLFFAQNSPVQASSAKQQGTGQGSRPTHPSAKSGYASWYSSAEACTNPKCFQANGRSLYDQEKTQPYFAASWDWPFATRLRVCHARQFPAQSWHRHAMRCITVTITDRGPLQALYRHGRILDLSRKSFAALAPLSEGVIEVTIRQERNPLTPSRER